MTTFAQALAADGRRRLPITEVRSLYRRTLIGSDPPDLRCRLLDALNTLAETGVVKLPKKFTDTSGNPALPASVTIVAVKKPEPAPRPPVAWIEELAFAAALPANSLRADIEKVNTWVKQHRGRDIPIVPLPERALEIFGHEKHLDSDCKNGRVLRGHVPLELIRARQVQLRMVHERFAAQGPVLVVENSAAFDSITAQAHTLGWAVIVWGAGRAIAATHPALDRLADGAPIYYLGDLDPPGIDTLAGVNEQRRQLGLPELRPLLSAYEWLVEHGHRRFSEAAVSDAAYAMLTDTLPPPIAERIAAIWRNGQIAPQEGLGTQVMVAAPFLVGPPV